MILCLMDLVKDNEECVIEWTAGVDLCMLKRQLTDFFMLLNML